MNGNPDRGSRVCLVDDDPVFRTTVVSYLERSGLEVEAYPSALAYLERREGDPPACLVLDLELPGLSGLELQELLGGAQAEVPIVFVSGYATLPDGVRAMRQGAVDFLQKPFPREALLRAVREALARDDASRAAARARGEAVDRIDRLSDRERRVCELVVQGLTNAEVAALLAANENTVKSLRKRAMEKLGVESLPDLVRLFDRRQAPPER
jgi:FixJ family two-component response regulator